MPTKRIVYLVASSLWVTKYFSTVIRVKFVVPQGLILSGPFYHRILGFQHCAGSVVELRRTLSLYFWSVLSVCKAVEASRTPHFLCRRRFLTNSIIFEPRCVIISTQQLTDRFAKRLMDIKSCAGSFHEFPLLQVQDLSFVFSCS